MGRPHHYPSDRFLYCDPIASHTDPHIQYDEGDRAAFLRGSGPGDLQLALAGQTGAFHGADSEGT